MPDSTTVVGLLNVPGAFAGLPDVCPGADKPVTAAAPLPGSVTQDEEKRGRGRPPKIPLTTDTLRDALTGQGISVRWNIITRRLEFSGVPDELNINPESLTQDFPVVLHDKLKAEYSGTLKDVLSRLKVISGQDRYNPVLDYITAEEWDGEKYLPTLIRILGLSNDSLSRALLGKWLLQAVALLHNDAKRRYSADGFLVLQGPQGIGKTTLVNVLGMKPEWTLTGGYLDARDKDTLIRLTSRFIAELGELDGTISRADAPRLKSFITAEADAFRRPYDVADTEQVRRTSFIGTVNGERFLVDPTGSRRFWVVPVEKIDLPALRKFNALGMWRQMLDFWRKQEANGHGGDCYRLTPEERTELEKRNQNHRVTQASEDEIRDIITEAETTPDNFAWRNCTVSEFKVLNATLTRFSVKAIGAALDAMGIEQKQVKIDGKPHRMRYLPCRKFS